MNLTGSSTFSIYNYTKKMYNVLKGQDKKTRNEIMTVIEERYLNLVPDMLKEIARQLKIANQLKAFELREKHYPHENVIDDIMENE